MSLDTNEKNITQITPIGMFADGNSFGIHDGVLVNIADTTTWAGVFKNGLSVDEQFFHQIYVRPVDSVIPTPINTNSKAYHYYFDYFDDLDHLDDLDRLNDLNHKQKREQYGISSRSKKSKEKTARSRQRKRKKPQKIMSQQEIVSGCGYDQLICNCYQCIENKKTFIEQRICDCCGNGNDDLNYYNSIYSESQTKMCDSCAMCECCPSCGWESGGSYCRYCRSESW
jgi:hypothetical protein